MLFGDRFPHGSRSMASGSGVRGEEESGKSTPLIPSVKSITISSLGKDSQRMKNVENSDTTKDFIARDGYGHPANVVQDRRKANVDVFFGDKEAPRTTVEITDGKRETWGDVLIERDTRETKGRQGEITVSDDEENVSLAAEMPWYSVDEVVPLNILPDSSHRDGSVYRSTDTFIKDYRIVDRSESK